MASLKYSRQREAIKDYLSSVTTHPTADTVYMHIKEEFQNISLGTVYRNLNLLAEQPIGIYVKRICQKMEDIISRNSFSAHVLAYMAFT